MQGFVCSCLLFPNQNHSYLSRILPGAAPAKPAGVAAKAKAKVKAKAKAEVDLAVKLEKKDLPERKLILRGNIMSFSLCICEAMFCLLRQRAEEGDWRNQWDAVGFHPVQI